MRDMNEPVAYDPTSVIRFQVNLLQLATAVHEPSPMDMTDTLKLRSLADQNLNN